MKINKILLKNWQYHEELELNFNSNINVITGQSESGKTCIFRALEWFFGFSNISENDFRREGTSETSVKVWFDNGFVIEKVRSNSLNRYILSKENCKDKIFDSINRDIPDEIQQVFEIKQIDIEKEHINLNFANQDQLNFLLDERYSDIFKAKLFNKLTGNELLDKIFKDLNKESLRFNRDIKDTEEKIEKQEEQLADVSLSYKSLKNKFCMVTDKYNNLKNDIKLYETLKGLSDSLKLSQENESFIKYKLSQIKLYSEDKIKSLKEDAEKIQKLQNLFYELDSLKENLKSIEEQKKSIKIIEVDWEKLKEKNVLIQQLTDINNAINKKKRDENIITQQKAEFDILLVKNNKELELLWTENKICPLCGK